MNQSRMLSGLAALVLTGLTVGVGQAQPVNDNFANAIVISGDHGTTNGTTVGATAEPGEPNHLGTAGASVWFSWTAPANGLVSMDTVGSSLGFDTLLAVYTGDTVSTLIGVTANDDFDPRVFGPSGVKFQARQGTTYRIVVDGFFGDTGNYVLNWAYNSAGMFQFAGVDNNSDTDMYAYNYAETESLGVRDPSTANSVRGALITVTRLFGAVGRVEVDCKTTNYTARSGRDYRGVTNTLVFDNYEMSKSFIVPIIYRAGPETNRTFKVVITGVRLAPQESTNIAPPTISPELGSAAVNILDCDIDPVVDNNWNCGTNPPPCAFEPTNSVFNFEKAVYRTREGVGVARVYVIRTGPPGKAETVNYTINSSPVDGDNDELNTFSLQPGSDYATPTPPDSVPPGVSSDYTPVRGTITFGENEFRPKLIDVPITDDLLAEFNEDLQLQIYQVVDGDVRRCGTVDRATLTILYDEYPAGALDDSHNLDYNLGTVPPNNPHPGANSTVYALAVQSDNKTVIGGSFSAYNTIPRNRIARLNEDGSNDNTFNPGTGANEFVTSIATNGEGKIIIGGGFTSYNGVQRNGIARLNPDGSLDTTFTPGLGANGTVWAVAVQGDGNLLIGGDFTSVNGLDRAYIARLNTNGVVDAAFDPGDVDGPVYALAKRGGIFLDATAAGDDKEDRRVINVGATSGILTIDYDLQYVPDFLRVYYDGVKIFDTGVTNGINLVVIPFGPGTSTDITIVVNEGGGQIGTAWSYTARIDPGNVEVVIGGEFTSIGGVSRNGIARLLADGTLDTTFDPGTGVDGVVYALAVQTGGKVLVGGSFGGVDIHSPNNITRLNGDGSFDETFAIGLGADDAVYSFALQGDDTLLVGGIFTSVNGTRRVGVARLLADGPVDTSFLDTAYNQFAGLPNSLSADPRNFVFALGLQANGDVMIGGGFERVGGGRYNSNIRTNVNDGESFSRATWRHRSNVARLLGGATTGPGNLELAYDSYTVDENGGSLYVSLVRTNGTLGPVSATLTAPPPPAGPGAARVGADYLATANGPQFVSSWPTTRMLSDGIYGPNYNSRTVITNRNLNDVRDDVYLEILDNTIVEGNRAANLELSTPNGTDVFFLGGENIPLGAALGRTAATLTIVDNDFKPGGLSLSAPEYSVTENATTAIITVLRTNGSDGAVTVQFATTNDTALAGVDYAPTNGTLTFNQGQTARSFAVRILNDTMVEPDESFGVRLFNPTGKATIGLTNAIVTIIDEDYLPGHVNFSSTNVSAYENDGLASVAVTRTGGSEGTLTVQFAMTNGTAFAGTDYTTTNGTLIWNNGDAAPKTIAVPLLDDLLIETNETVNLRLFNATRNGEPDSQPLGSRTNATLTIVSDDFLGAVRFSTATYSINENGGSAYIAVVRTNGSAESIVVNFSATSGTAVAGIDFTATNGTLTFGPGELSKTFTVPIIDNSPNTSATRSISLLLANASPGAGLGIPSAATLAIIDDESVNEPPGSADTSYSAAAGFNGVVNALALQTDGKLLVGGEFTEANGLMRNRIARLNLNGTLDGGFSLTATNAGANATVRALIRQTDGRIVIGGDFTTVNSAARNHLARLNLDGSLDGGFDPGGGADGLVFALAEMVGGGGARKLLVGGGFTVINAVNRNRIARLNNDGTVDPTFDPGLGANGLVYAIAVQADGKAVIGGEFTTVNGVGRSRVARLNPDGSLDPSFNPGTGANDAVRALALQLDGRILIGGLFTNYNGTALNRFARLNANGTLDSNFKPGVGANNTVSAITVQEDTRIVLGGQFTRCNGLTRNHITRLNSDGAVDPTINFGLGANNFVAATAVQTDGKIIIGGGFTEYDGATRQRIARIYGGSIAGSGRLEFSAAIFSANESDTNVLITVRRRGGTSSPPGQSNVTVNAVTSNGTATNGAHYAGGTFTNSFAPGEVLQTFLLPLTNDFAINPNRTVNLALTNVVPAGSATLGYPALGNQPTATLIITNDDSAITFSSPTYVRNENAIDGVATISIVRTGSTVGTAAAEFRTTANGTATSGQDFTPVTYSVVFNPGETLKTVTIPILNDTSIEGDETVTMRLSNVTGALPLEPSQAVLTIVDDDFGPGEIGFTAASYSVAENGRNAVISLVRTNGRTGTVAVDFFTIDVTAEAGSDYAELRGTVLFGEGETSKNVLVPVFNDGVVEDDEIFRVTLTNATGGATLRSPTTVPVTIVDAGSGTGILPSGAKLVVDPNDNGVIDPGETVTLLFALRNVGGVDTTNLVATLLATNGVTAPNPTNHNYGSLASGGASVSRAFSFTANGANGVTIAPTFQLQDGSFNYGWATFYFQLGTNTSTTTFSNAAPILINDRTGDAPAAATPYPSTIMVAGVSDNVTVSKVAVTLTNLAHTHPDDIDMLLVGPGGQNLVLMSDAGGSSQVTNVTLKFDDAAAGELPDSGQIISGTFKPSNFLAGDSVPSPAPAPSTNKVLSVFKGSSPNGPWSLYVVDDTQLDGGAIERGWYLTITTTGEIPAAADLSVTMTAAPDPAFVGGNLTYTVVATNHGPWTATGIALTNTLPAGAVYVSSSPGQGTISTSSGQLVWTVGTLTNNGVASATIVVRPTGVGTVSSTSSAFAVEADPNAANNTVSVQTIVTELRLSVSVVRSPRLSVSSVSNNLVIAWPTAAAEYELESTTNLTPPVVWTTSPPPVIVGGQKMVTNSLVGSAMFFRLRAQAPTQPLAEITWPVNATGYTLECATNLTPPMVWTPVTNPPPVTYGYQQTVTLPVVSGNVFFRLRGGP